MADKSWVLALLVGAPWIVLFLDAFALGFHLEVAVAMLFVFSLGLLFLAAVAQEG